MVVLGRKPFVCSCHNRVKVTPCLHCTPEGSKSHIHEVACSEERRITQQGHINVTPYNVKAKGLRYTFDLFSKLVELNWGWTLLTFCVGYFGTWIFFAIGWYLILYVHGDLDPANAVDRKNGKWRKPCITGIQDFRTAFLFSVETQHTTGYGFYQVTEECMDAIILLCVQSIVGVILEGVLVGLVFLKMSGAKKRAAAILFSRNAVITRQNGKSFFMFRVGDIEKTHLLDVKVRAHFVKNRQSGVDSCQIVHCGQEKLEVHGEGETNNKLLLFWPTIILHEIDEHSPFFTLSQADLGTDNREFEVIVVIEGTMEATGIKTQARSSYVPREILMGCSFKDLMEATGKSNAGERLVDYTEFHETILTPVESCDTVKPDEMTTEIPRELPEWRDRLYRQISPLSSSYIPFMRRAPAGDHNNGVKASGGV